jgi:hypothetical protein
MNSTSNSGLSAQNEGEIRRLEHLRQAIDALAMARGDSPAQVAQALGMSLGHLYRLKKEPERLSRLALDRLDAIAEYVGWTRVQVMIAVGWLRQAEVDQFLSEKSVLQQAWRRLTQGGLANGLTTPLEKAAADHRDLMARLLLLAEAGASMRAITPEQR